MSEKTWRLAKQWAATEGVSLARALELAVEGLEVGEVVGSIAGKSLGDLTGSGGSDARSVRDVPVVHVEGGAGSTRREGQVRAVPPGAEGSASVRVPARSLSALRAQGTAAGTVTNPLKCRRCGHSRVRHILGAHGTRCDCMTCPAFQGGENGASESDDVADAGDAMAGDDAGESGGVREVVRTEDPSVDAGAGVTEEVPLTLAMRKAWLLAQCGGNLVVASDLVAKPATDPEDESQDDAGLDF